MGRYTTLATILCSIAPLLAQPSPLPFAPFLPDGLIPVSCPPRTNDDAPGEADFLILGAGLAGLGAAHYLHAHTTGCIIRVLEARDVPGGRVRTLPEGPFAGMEVGAGWIHEYKGNPMLSVADANGLYTKWVGGNSSYVGGDLIRIFDNGTELDAATRDRSYKLMSNLTSGIEAQAEWRFKNNATDASVLEVVANLTRDQPLTAFDLRLARWNLDVVYGGDWAAPMAELSIKSHQHGYLNYEGGDCVFPDGFAQVPKALALGVDVRYSQLATNITWGHGRVDVSTADGQVWRGRNLLLTQSIGVLQSNIISFHPPMPRSKTEVINKFGMSALNRVMLRFPKPFWTNDTYTLGFLPDHSEVFEVDSTPDDDDDDNDENDDVEWATAPLFSVAVNAAYEDRPVGSGGVLSFMVGGDSGEAIFEQSKKKIVRHLLRLLRSAFGYDSVPKPTDVYISDWKSEPLARGSYAFIPVNTSIQHDLPRLAEPVKDSRGEPRLFFAGEATLSGPARGTTHGAFLSGIREGARMLGRARVVERVTQADIASAAPRDANVVSALMGTEGALMIDDWFLPLKEKMGQFVVQA